MLAQLGIIVTKGCKFGDPEETVDILILSLVVSQGFEQDERKLSFRASCHSVLGSYLHQFRY